LTRYLIALNTKFFAIEKDDTLIPILNESFSGVQVFNQDVLEFDINQIEDLEKTLIV
jgi:16S rRNA A1518/A1519 N6-dimethyltransferase RsmA/KsgA/DIM1 with predicted DNA glycosylase/AP lyase activity